MKEKSFFKKNWHWFLLMIILVVSIGIYSYVNIMTNPDKIWNWFNTLLSTSVSIFFAFIIGILIFNWSSKKSANERKENLKKLVQAELSHNSRYLESKHFLNITVNNIEMSLIAMHMEPLALGEAIKSGLFNSVESENMIHLSEKMRNYNVKLNFLFSVLPSSIEPKQRNDMITTTIQNLEKARESILSNIDTILKQFGLSLSPSKNSD